MTWVAVAIGGSALVGAGASYLGSKKQAGAAKDAANLQMQQFGVINQQQQPFIRSAYGATGRLNTLLGINPNPYRNQMTLPRPVMGGQMNAQGANPMMGSSNLNRILMLRAMNGDQQASSILNRPVM